MRHRAQALRCGSIKQKEDTMRQRIRSMLLALALALSLGAVPVLADQTPQPEPSAADPAETEQTQTEEGETAPAEGAEETEEAAPADSPAGPDQETTGEELEIVPDPVGTVSFENLERRIREHNLQLLALEENVTSLEGMDYEAMQESLRKRLHNFAQGKWIKQTDEELANIMGLGEVSLEFLNSSYDALREQFDAIRDGELQKDNAGVIRQLKNLQDQIVMSGETLYMAIYAMETQETALQRQLAAMNRTVEEMELRYELGQISALQLQQTKSGRTSLVSGLDTLQMNIRNYKLQLEMLIGAELTGEIELGAMPSVTDQELEKMDEEADLAAAKEQSYEIYAAEQTMKDAEDAYVENMTAVLYIKDSVERTLEAAKYTYNASIQDYELRFRMLYAQVQDYRQILSAAQTALACEQASYAAQELKYQQGSISENTLLSARDTLQEAEETVESAKNDLFSAYNSYCWAVEHGILNG